MTSETVDTAGSAEIGPGSHKHSRRLTLFSHYALVVAALLVPMLAVIALAGRELVETNRSLVDRSLEESARTLALAVDSDLRRRITSLEAFATAPEFGFWDEEHDLPALYGHAQRMADLLETEIVIVRPDLSQVLNTRQPLDAELPQTAGGAVISRAFETGRPAMSNLVFGAVAQRYVIGASVPVLDDSGEARLVVAAPFDPSTLVDLLGIPNSEPGVFTTLVDGNNKVVARSPHDDRFIGGDVPAWWLEAAGDSPNGIAVGPNLQGTNVIIAHAPVPIAPGWRLATALPESRYDDAWRQPLLLVVIGVLVAMAVSLAMGLVLVRQVQAPLARIAQRARAGTDALRSGKPIPEVSTETRAAKVREIEAVRSSIAVFTAAIRNRDARQSELMQDLSDALAERDLFLAEVNHRVKNNLQMLDALLGFEEDAADGTDPMEIIRRMQLRIRSISLIHQQLLELQSASKVDLDNFIPALCRNIATAAGAEQRGIAVIAEADPVGLDLGPGTALGLLVNELLSNALIHAFPDHTSGQVQVRLRMQPGGRAVLEVIDNGVGLEAASTPSTGSLLIELLVEQLKGQYSVDSGDGTHVRIEFQIGEHGDDDG